MSSSATELDMGSESPSHSQAPPSTHSDRLLQPLLGEPVDSSPSVPNKPKKLITRMDGKGSKGCLTALSLDEVTKIRQRCLVGPQFEIQLPSGQHQYADEPPEGFCTVYEAQLSSGLRFPLCPAVVALLHHYEISVSQLAPNAVRTLMGFVIACRVAGVCFSIPLFRYYYKITGLPDKLWYTFQRRANRHEFVSKGPLSHSDWKPRFFFIRHGLDNPYIGQWRSRGKKSDKLDGGPASHEARTLDGFGFEVSTRDLRSKSTKEGRGDTSAWTDTPSERAQKAKTNYLEAYNEATALASNEQDKKRMSTEAEMVEQYNKAKRSKSLIEKHRESSSSSSTQNRGSKKKKSRQEESAKKDEDWEGKHPWKPWDREKDLTAGRLSVKLDTNDMAQGLSSRFSSSSFQKSFL